MVLLVELSRDGFVDVSDHRVLPERIFLIHGGEAGNFSRAGNNTRSGKHIETVT